MPVVYGLKAQLMLKLMNGPGYRLRKKIPEGLQNITDSQLRSKGSIVIPTHEMLSITLKTGTTARYGLFVSPEIDIEIQGGKKMVFGTHAWDFDKVSHELKNCYPQLYR